MKEQIGTKAYNLARAQEAGFNVPSSYVLTTKAYRDFISRNKLASQIDVELGRRDKKKMRWEELWDSALRIQHMISRSVISKVILNELEQFLSSQGSVNFAFRSSSPSEDLKQASFAGLYNSLLNIKKENDIESTLKNIWGSLWTDKTLLYQDELGLDSINSSMAILIQPMSKADFSGVAFSCDPNNFKDNSLFLEVVRGQCNQLVDGTMKPTLIKLSRDLTFANCKTICDGFSHKIIIKPHELLSLHKHILATEHLFGRFIDVEWSFYNGKLTILQIRPVTCYEDKNIKRKWYLTLTPNDQSLTDLSNEVSNRFIPELESEINMLDMRDGNSDSFNDIYDNLNHSFSKLKKWQAIYVEKLIPLAHGIRRFGVYYNDLMTPADPYEFVRLLETTEREANKRQLELIACSSFFAKDQELKNFVIKWIDSNLKIFDFTMLDECSSQSRKAFQEAYKNLKNSYFQSNFDLNLYSDRDDVILKLLLFYHQQDIKYVKNSNKKLLEDFLKASSEIKVSKNLLHIAKLSWSLRDDDNLLLSKIKSYCISQIKQLKKPHANVSETEIKKSQELIKAVESAVIDHRSNKISKSLIQARQLKGQPAVKGIISGYAHQVCNIDDIKSFQPGNIIVTDVIDPQMTHIVPLAAAIVERRGGMLIHSTIVARELGIPCVNGIDDLMGLVQNGDYLTVDGEQGIIIIH